MRGAIVLGDMYLDDNIVFGEGLVRAVEGEKQATHPRVVVDDSALRGFEDGPGLSFVREDFDKKHYIDYFQYVDLEQNDRDGSERVQLVLEKLGGNLVQRVKKYCQFPGRMTTQRSIAIRESVIAKHLWALERFNEFCSANGYENYGVAYKPVLNRPMPLAF